MASHHERWDRSVEMTACSHNVRRPFRNPAHISSSTKPERRPDLPPVCLRFKPSLGTWTLSYRVPFVTNTRRLCSHSASFLTGHRGNFPNLSHSRRWHTLLFSTTDFLMTEVDTLEEPDSCFRTHGSIQATSVSKPKIFILLICTTTVNKIKPAFNSCLPPTCYSTASH